MDDEKKHTCMEPLPKKTKHRCVMCIKRLVRGIIMKEIPHTHDDPGKVGPCRQCRRDDGLVQGKRMLLKLFAKDAQKYLQNQEQPGGGPC
jgi:hypothetical protein